MFGLWSDVLRLSWSPRMSGEAIGRERTVAKVAEIRQTLDLR